MNIKIRHETTFTAGVHWMDKLYMTNYTVNIHLITNCLEPEEQNIAMDRLKVMVREQFTSSVFINQNNQKQIKKYLAAGVEVTPMPEDPLDQIVGIMLFCKLSAVMEGRLLIANLELNSELGDMIFYSHTIDEPVGPFADAGWWNSADPVHNDLGKYIKRTTDERIVEMQKPQSWKDYGFHWSNEVETPVESTVLYADFPRKHED